MTSCLVPDSVLVSPPDDSFTYLMEKEGSIDALSLEILPVAHIIEDSSQHTQATQ